MIVCPVCETHVEFGFECEVCGKDLSAALGALPPAPITIQKMAELEQTIPDVRSVMHHALQNVRPSHLLDPDLQEAWAQRPAHIEPKGMMDKGTRRMTGQVVQRGGALRIVGED